MVLKAFVGVLVSLYATGFHLKILGKLISGAAAFIALSAGCGGGAGDTAPVANVPTIQSMGSISMSLTDGPWEDASALVLHITGMDLGHSNGDVIGMNLPGGPISVDMMQLQNGVFRPLFVAADLPAGQYDWIRLRLDLSLSYIDLAGTGGRHGMQMGSNARNGLEVHESFQILNATHHEFMLDFDMRRGVQRHNMGMMGEQFELYSTMRLVNLDAVGGVAGMVDASMIDINHANCDPAPGGNWAYLFPGDATDPDDVAVSESDGIPGPIATDRIEMDPATGDHWFHFDYIPAGSYRVALTCSSEWDEEGDDDYPSDPDGQFHFLMMSDPIDVAAGQMHRFDMMP